MTADRKFVDLFDKATGHAPYPFQSKFAEAENLPHLLRAPTGAGKTATAVLGWLWRRLHRSQATPRRLVYCLPMRVLVEQSYRESKKWLENLGLARDIDLHLLMGGAESEPWHLHPERPAILIGTQDMLLSRALNRGYAASRYHWPIDFGLLNNDCLWVFDEPQLMAGGVSTSAQLAGLRRSLETAGNCPSIWMSATLEPGWLDTVDFRGKFDSPPLELSDKDYSPELPLHRRMTAKKTLFRLDATSSKDMKTVAKAAFAKHKGGTTTLVVLNTVDRAKATFEEIVKLRKKSGTPSLLLIHSRFRPADRERLNESLMNPGDDVDRIVIATQVVEAGVDLSARTLITELCPWSSVVQRIGRCNRTGQDGPGEVYWIDLDEKQGMPYEDAALSAARTWLQHLEGQDVSPKSLDDFKVREKIQLPFEHKHVLRRKDLLDLFDTAPDLSGNDIDISRFVRSDDPDTDLMVYWRQWAGEFPPEEFPGPRREELCRVPLLKMRDFASLIAGNKRGPALTWDHLDERWRPVDPKQLRPGMTILLPCQCGGYSGVLGWHEDSMDPVDEISDGQTSATLRDEGLGSDPISSLSLSKPLTVAQHTENVCVELDKILKTLTTTNRALITEQQSDDLRIAARWHDLGKAHDAFQAGMRSSNPSLAQDQLWAKSGVDGRLQHGRRFFRHELASALIVTQQHAESAFEIAYLIAAHHGRVRLSIRSAPDEDLSQGDASVRFALGNRDGDQLPTVDLGDGVTSPAAVLDLSPMEMGGDASWTARALQLLREMGPFRLAYLEAILRAADVRASMKEAGKDV